MCKAKENGCLACHFEKYNFKKSLDPHTCGKVDNSILEAREIYYQIINTRDNHMCRQPNTPMEYKHQELMNELNEFMIAAKLHLHAGKIITGADLNRRYPKPSIEEIDALQRRINEVLQKDACPLVKYYQEPMDVKPGPNPGTTEY